MLLRLHALYTKLRSKEGHVYDNKAFGANLHVGYGECRLHFINITKRKKIADICALLFLQALFLLIVQYVQRNTYEYYYRCLKETIERMQVTRCHKP